MELPKLPIANTIRDQVYQLLKDEICDGRYEPGYWLQEKELAQRLNRRMAGDDSFYAKNGK